MRHPSRWFACVAAVLAAWLTPLSGKTVTVDQQAGDDAHNGTSPQESVRTLARAVALLAPGDVLAIVPGSAPYFEALEFGARGGLPGRPIVVEGNGAVLSGLLPIPAEQWQDRGDGLWFYPTAFRHGSLVPFMVLPDGTRVPSAAKADAVAVGQAFWDARGILLRCDAGRRPGDLGLRGTLRAAGVALAGASHITVRNLACEYFANDGFNIHGSCQGLFFENIVARHNGDDGFSVHEDVGATVHGGWFHDNTFGIQDVNLSRSQYVGIRVEHNRAHGVHFNGGAHSVSDSLIRDNVMDQLRVDPDAARHLGVAVDNPFCAGTVYVHNTVILGGRNGVMVTAGSRVALTSCFIAGAQTGLQAGPDAVLHVNGSAVVDCGTREVHSESALCRLNGNAYWPGRFRWLAELYGPEQFAAYQDASGQDAASVLSAPAYSGKSFRLAAPQVLSQDRLRAPGITADLSLPFGDPVAPPQHAVVDVDAARKLHFDFESFNPWSRVYPVPEKGPDGQPIPATATLSAEQAVSGGHSVKLDAVLPAGGPATWTIKLFSVRLDPCTRPVRALRLQLFGDGSGTPFCLRVRDAAGESFAGPEMRLDWQGWREIAWDLQATPPRAVPGMTGDGRQDCPPVEIVLDLHPQVGPEGAHLVLYADDLDVLLETP